MGASARSSRRGRCAGRCTCCVADELPRYVGALARLRPRHHVPAWLRYHGLEREQADAMLAAIADALRGAAADARGSSPRPSRERVGDAGARRAAEGRLRRPAQARGVHRRPLLRAERRPARALHAPGGLARRLGAGRAGERGRERGRADLPARVRPRAARAVPALVRDDVAGRGRALDQGARRRGRGGRRRGRRAAGCSPPTSRPPRPPSPPASYGCCPASTTTSSRRRAPPTRCCRPRTASASTARRAGSRRRCSPTAGSLGVWSHEQNGDALRVTVEPFGRVPTHVRAGAEAEAERLAAIPRR